MCVCLLGINPCERKGVEAGLGGGEVNICSGPQQWASAKLAGSCPANTAPQSRTMLGKRGYSFRLLPCSCQSHINCLGKGITQLTQVSSSACAAEDSPEFLRRTLQICRFLPLRSFLCLRVYLPGSSRMLSSVFNSSYSVRLCLASLFLICDLGSLLSYNLEQL